LWEISCFKRNQRFEINFSEPKNNLYKIQNWSTLQKDCMIGTDCWTRVEKSSNLSLRRFWSQQQTNEKKRNVEFIEWCDSESCFVFQKTRLRVWSERLRSCETKLVKHRYMSFLIVSSSFSGLAPLNSSIFFPSL
jgi:hypothetical protein